MSKVFKNNEDIVLDKRFMKASMWKMVKTIFNLPENVQKVIVKKESVECFSEGEE